MRSSSGSIQNFILAAPPQEYLPADEITSLMPRMRQRSLSKMQGRYEYK